MTIDTKENRQRRVQESRELAKEANEVGVNVGFGTVIHALTDYFGIEHCAKCQERKIVLNRAVQIRNMGLKINWQEVKEIIRRRGLTE